MCGYLNINSIRNKHEYIRDLLQRNLVDILFLSETKIDASFKKNLSYSFKGRSMHFMVLSVTGQNAPTTKTRHHTYVFQNKSL
jgi:exonuclease III